MKVRMGFVTNSSSSSFIILLRRQTSIDSLVHANDVIPEPLKERAITSIQAGRIVSKAELRDFLKENYELRVQYKKFSRSHNFDWSFQPLKESEWKEIEEQIENLLNHISDSEDICIVVQGDETADDAELEHIVFPQFCLEYFSNH